MTRNIAEPSVVTELANQGYRIRQLERRPPPLEGLYEIKVFADEGTGSTVETGDGKFIWAIPFDLNQTNLVDADAFITTLSSSGLVTVQIRNITQAVDMLSTRITIDVGEYHSFDAAAQPVINQANNTVTTGDRLAVDVDVAGTGTKGLGVILRFDPYSPYP